MTAVYPDVNTMPEPAAELVVNCYHSERAEVADEVVSHCGFRGSVVNGSVIKTDRYTAYHYEPFEVREENRELLEQCVEELTQAFPSMNVWLSNKSNKDYGNPVTEDYLLYIAPGRHTVEGDKTDSISATDVSTAGEGQMSEQESSSKIDWKSTRSEF
jgi:hypothetical protein